MPEGKPPASAAPSAPSRGGGFELRLERTRAFVCLGEQELLPGLRLLDFAMEVPEVRFPFDVGQGAAQFRSRLCDLTRLQVSFEPRLLGSLAAGLELSRAGLAGLELSLRAGYVEAAGRLDDGNRFTFKLGVEPHGDQALAAVVYESRVYGPSAVPAAALSALLGRAAPGIARLEGATLVVEPLGALLRRLLPARGWKLPRTDGARLAEARLQPGELRLRWDRAHAGPAESPADPERLSAMEGARAFRDAEALLARGDWDAAREAYLADGASASTHPFAASRLLSLLSLDPRFHDEALDLAASWLARRPDFGPALLAEGVLRALRGERARAARAFAELAAAAARQGEELGTLAAAEACFAQGPDSDVYAVSRAVELALALRRDHLPALRALLAIAERTGDREAFLRSCRRLAAYAPEDGEKASAHARLAEMLLSSDPPSARLHLDQALRLAPDDEAALRSLARACAEAGEFLRAARAHDRLRELHLARGRTEEAAAAALEVGALWEDRLGHPENALLRYREACELSPGSTEARERAARAADALGHWADAAEHYGALLSSLRLGMPGASERSARAHRAMARIAELRLSDPARAASHLESALAAEPGDGASLERLADLYRRLGRPAELLATIDRLAPLAGTPAARAALLAEAGAIGLDALGLADAARTRFAAALAADPRCRPALEGLVRIAADRGEGAAEREALEKLALLAGPGAELAAVQDRLVGACERSGDLAGAARAAAAARRAEPTPTRLTQAIRVARLSGDPAALADLLAEQAAAARGSGDRTAAAAAWLERARLVRAGSPAQALASLAEARALAPADPRILREQAGLAEETGDLPLALSALQALLVAGAPDAAALELRAARAAAGARDAAAARAHAERALALGEEPAAALLADVLQGSGEHAARAALLERAGRLEEASRDWELAGSPDRARAALERAAADPAAADDAVARLAEARLAAGDRAGGAEALVRLARRRGGSEGARLALRAAGLDAAGAGEALDLALASDPDLLPARMERARHLAERAPARALADCELLLSAPAQAPGAPDPAARLALRRLAARAAAAAGDGETARRHLAAYCQGAPGDAAALEDLAGLHRAAGDAPALAQALSRLRELARGPAAVAVGLELALLRAAEADRRAEAAALLREVLERDPSSVEALRALLSPQLADQCSPAERAELLGRLAAGAGVPDGEAAGALVEQARLAASGEAPGGEPAALELARAAARRSPRHPGAQQLLAELAARAGEPSEAARALLARAALAREAGEPDVAGRSAAAGHSALAAGLIAEGREALAAGLALGLDRGEARSAWAALAAQARAGGEAAEERAALEHLVPLLRAGDRPAALLRLAELQLSAGEVAAARRSAAEALALAPRDPAALEACRAAAEREGDQAAVAALLAEIAAVDPERAGERLLERGRLLAGPVGQPLEADRAYAEALACLPPDASLAAEHSRLRRERPPLRRLPWAEPLEAFARRCPDRRAAAAAWRDAAYLSLAQEDAGAALRCARRAYARTREEPGFAGPLLARVLYRLGGGGEALVLHRTLLESGFQGIDEGDAAVLCRQLAELAEEAGEADLALSALDRLLELRAQDLEAAEWRFRLDPDRRRAVRTLAEAAGAARSARSRSRALGIAAGAALDQLGDGPLAQELWHRARAEAAGYPGLLARLAAERLEAARRRAGEAAPGARAELLEALHAAAAAWRDAGDAEAARPLLEEAIEIQARSGDVPGAAADLRALEDAASARGDARAAAACARKAGLLHLEAGDAGAAEQALRRALARDRDDAPSWEALQRIAEARGDEGVPLLAEVLAARAERAAGRERAEALLAQAALLAGPLADGERAVQRLREALAVDPAFDPAETALEHLLRDQGRSTELARLLLARAARGEDPAVRAAQRREAAEILAAAGDPAGRTAAAEAALGALADLPGELALSRLAAGLLVQLGRTEEAIPHLWAALRADPEDEAVAAQLASALAGRHRERAEMFLERARAASGAARAGRLREAAKALFAAGEEPQGRALLREAFDCWPADDAAFLAAVRDAAADIDRLDAVLLARARAVPEEAAGCHRARADALLAFGREEAARRAFGDCLALDPDDAGALAGLADHLASREGDPAAAALDERLCALAERAAGQVPGSVEARARYRLGLAAWSRGRPGEDVAHLERALELSPEDERAGVAWAALASGRADRGDGAGALAAARRRAERAEAHSLSAERAEALEAGAALAAQFGDAGEDAAAILEALASLRLAEGGEPPEALAELVGRAARALRAAGAPERADGLERLAALAHPGPAEPFPPEAAGIAEPGLPAPPAEPEAAPARASPEDMRAALERACEAEPDETSPWRALAEFETEQGNHLAAARALLAVALRATGEDAATAALAAARFFGEAGQEEEALRAYHAAVHAATGCYPARRALAEAALRRGNPAAAADHLAAVDLAEVPSRERLDLARDRARALEAAGQPDAARASWEEVFDADPADEEAFDRVAPRPDPGGRAERWLQLVARHEAALGVHGSVDRRRDLRCERARVFAAMGRREAAEGAWRAALELDPGCTAALEALRALAAPAEPVLTGIEAAAAAAAMAEPPAAAPAEGTEELPLEPVPAPAQRTQELSLEPAAPPDLAELEPIDLSAIELRPAETVPAPSGPAPQAGQAPLGDAVASAVESLLAGLAPASAGEPGAGSRLAGLRAAAGSEPGNDAAQEAWALAAAEAGDHEQARQAWTAALSAGAGQRPEVLERRRLGLARALDALGRVDEALVVLETAAEDPGAEGAARELGRLLRESAQALAEAGRPQDAFARLQRARVRAPSDTELAAELGRLAEQLERFEDAVALGELAADGDATRDPVGAAARFRHCARVLRDRIGDPDRAAALLEKALTLLPADEDLRAELEAVRARRGEAAARELEATLEQARQGPLDEAAAARVASLCRQLAAAAPEPGRAAAFRERARVAESLVRFLHPDFPASEAAPLAERVPPEVAARAAYPGSDGPLASLLALLAPYLEPLFPADLARRGVGPDDRVGQGRAPALLGRLDSAVRALGARPAVAFLAPRAGTQVMLENTRPPSLVIGTGALSLPAGGVAFLVARAVWLTGRCFTLIGKFAPRDVLILCELASRFAGGAPPALGLPPARAGAFLAALEGTVPPEVRSRAAALGAASAEELRDLEPGAFAAALQRTAGRVALLHTGDLHGALSALAALRSSEDPLRALALPDLRDLVLFALSDLFLELRAQVVGSG